MFFDKKSVIRFSIKTHSIIGFLIKFIDRNFIISFVSLWSFLGSEISLNYGGNLKRKLKWKIPDFPSLPVLIFHNPKTEISFTQFFTYSLKESWMKTPYQLLHPTEQFKIRHPREIVWSVGRLKWRCKKKSDEMDGDLFSWGFKPGEHWKCIFIR